MLKWALAILTGAFLAITQPQFVTAMPLSPAAMKAASENTTGVKRVWYYGPRPYFYRPRYYYRPYYGYWKPRYYRPYYYGYYRPYYRPHYYGYYRPYYRPYYYRPHYYGYYGPHYYYW